MNEETNTAASHNIGGVSPISTHRAFAPILIVWAAALLSLSVAVIPTAIAQQFGASIGLGNLAPFALAAMAGLTGAIFGFGAAQVIQSFQSKVITSIPTLPIEQPMAELAEPEESQSIDVEETPIEVLSEDVLVLADAISEEEPAEADLADSESHQLDKCADLLSEADKQPQAAIEIEPLPILERSDAETPQFLPWPDAIEQPSAEILANPDPNAHQAPEKEQVTSVIPNVQGEHNTPTQTELSIKRAAPGKAVQRLRSEAVDEMNMVQLLERFAVALGDYRQYAEAPHSVSVDYSMASPSEALDALTDPIDDGTRGHLRTGVSVRTRAIETENALRDALAKLDRLSGAA